MELGGGTVGEVEVVTTACRGLVSTLAPAFGRIPLTAAFCCDAVPGEGDEHAAKVSDPITNSAA